MRRPRVLAGAGRFRHGRVAPQARGSGESHDRRGTPLCTGGGAAGRAARGVLGALFPIGLPPLRTEGERQAALVRAAREQETRKRKREELEEHLDAKKKRYAPALAAAKAKHPDPSVIDEEETCVTVFEASEDYGNEEPTRCPYDRKNGGLFCSMCLVMAERCGA